MSSIAGSDASEIGKVEIDVVSARVGEIQLTGGRTMAHGGAAFIQAHTPLVESKRRAIMSGGLERLQVVLDFDHTVTAYLMPDGRVRCHECHDVIQNHSSCRNPQLKSDIDKIWEDCKAGRLPGDGLRAWWERFHSSMVRHRFSRQDIVEAVDFASISLRPGAVEVFEWLRRNNIKTTIISAGISAVIEEFLDRHDLLHDNVNIVANVPEWDEDGVLVRWKDPLIYSQNKPDVLREMGFAAEGGKARNNKKNLDRNRKPIPNIVLAGNSIGDALCLLGIDHEHSLAFGFLHEELVVDDHCFDVIKEMGQMQKIASSESEELVEFFGQRQLIACPRLTDEGARKLEKFIEHYDIVLCGLQTDFGMLLDFFTEVEKLHLH